MNATPLLSIADWLASGNAARVRPIDKDTTDTQAWFAIVGERESFLKYFPADFAQTRAAVEIAVAGADLHPAIVPLRQTVPLQDGVLLVYDRVNGESLAPMEARKRFQFLPLAERIAATTAIIHALSAVCNAGFMVVDWYEGNMIYDFDRQQIWLFDWELCRMGSGFMLEMDNNYGSSRLMAPEEFVRGRFLDERTLVFNLGRYALMTLPELAESLAPVLAIATHPARAERFATIHQLAQALVNAL